MHFPHQSANVGVAPESANGAAGTCRLIAISSPASLQPAAFVHNADSLTWHGVTAASSDWTGWRCAATLFQHLADALDVFAVNRFLPRRAAGAAAGTAGVLPDGLANEACSLLGIYKSSSGAAATQGTLLLVQFAACGQQPLFALVPASARYKMHVSLAVKRLSAKLHAHVHTHVPCLPVMTLTGALTFQPVERAVFLRLETDAHKELHLRIPIWLRLAGLAAPPPQG